MILLAARVWNTVAAVFCGILFFVPLVGLLVLSSRASKLLKDAGYDVGLLGVNPAQFRRRGA